MSGVKRKAIPLRVKLEVALARLGLRIEQVEWDHQPPIELRPVDPATGDTVPPQNDPLFIQLLTIDEHRVKTFGTPATTAGSDIHKIAKSRRIIKAQEEFRARLLAKEQGEPAPRRDKIKSRGFPKRPKAER